MSLLEVLVAVAVIGTAMLAAMAGLFTTVRESGANAERQQRSAAMSSFGESLKGLTYAPCADATGTGYTASYGAWPSRWTPATGAAPDISTMTMTVTRVEYWDSSSRTFTTTCADDGGTQRLTLDVAWRGQNTSSTLVKRDPRALP